MPYLFEPAVACIYSFVYVKLNVWAPVQPYACLLGCDAMWSIRLLLSYCLHLSALKMEAAGASKTSLNIYAVILMCGFGFRGCTASNVEGFSTFRKTLHLPYSGLMTSGGILAALTEFLY
jgi:hypothetical protein